VCSTLAIGELEPDQLVLDDYSPFLRTDRESHHEQSLVAGVFWPETGLATVHSRERTAA
jgi:hypothetical protein